MESRYKGDAEGPTENRRILEEASDDTGALLRCAANHGWRGIEPMVSFDASSLPDWVEPGWYAQLMHGLLKIARRTPLVILESGERIASQDAWIPHGENDEQCLTLANLGAGLREAATKLPRADLISTWSRNIVHWARLLGSAPRELSEVLTLSRIAQRVDAARTLKTLQASLMDGVSAVSWLGSLIQYIHTNDFGILFDELALLPDQSGALRRRSELKRDMDIDEELKQIAAALEFDLRPTLLDLRIQSQLAADFLLPATEEQTLTAAIQHLRDCSDDGCMPRGMVVPSAALFAWIAVRPHFEHHLRGFPVATADGDRESFTRKYGYSIRVQSLDGRAISADVNNPGLVPAMSKKVEPLGAGEAALLQEIPLRRDYIQVESVDATRKRAVVVVSVTIFNVEAGPLAPVSAMR